MTGRRRRALLTLSALLAFPACGSPRPSAKTPTPVALHLEPACDLAPAAGLDWLVEASPRVVAQNADLIGPIATVVPEVRLNRFTKAHGGVDLRQVHALCIAHYKNTSLTVARTPFDPATVEAAFAARATRDVRRTSLAPVPPVIRLSTAAEETNAEQITLFGRDALIWEQGHPGPLRASEAFAFGKLKKATPALRGAALAKAAELLGEAPVRAFAPGPFDGETARGLGGLLRATTAIGASARFAGADRIAVKVVLTGGWKDDASIAADRLASAANVLASSALGRLLGLDHPSAPSRTYGTADALVFETTLDAMALAKGLHDALDAEVTEILR